MKEVKLKCKIGKHKGNIGRKRLRKEGNLRKGIQGDYCIILVA